MRDVFVKTVRAPTTGVGDESKFANEVLAEGGGAGCAYVSLA